MGDGADRGDRGGGRGDRSVTVIGLAEAAALIRLSPEAVMALAESGYLRREEGGDADPAFRLADLKAFVARNSDSVHELFSFERSLDELERVDPGDLLDALDGRAGEMARRVFEIFSTVFPEARGWGLREQARFIEQARARFEAILAVTGQGAEVDEALAGDLQEVGAQAAWSGSPLPQLLVILRISRDLVVQTAVELAEERGRHWGLALSLLLTRILPAMDRLTDALAQGYWSAILGREESIRARYQDVVEHSSDGVYETDLEGRIHYVNPSFALIMGRRLEELDQALLSEVIRPLDATTRVNARLLDPDGGHLIMTVARADGVRRVLDIQTMPRSVDGALVGFQGVVRDETAARDLEADKNEFLAMVTHDLRNPSTTILGLGATLESHAAELSSDQILRMGESIRRHAERIARLADDLYDVSRLEARDLLVSQRSTGLRSVVESALGSVADPSAVVVEVADDLIVLADPRRLEQVVANLVENAIEHGAPPVVVTAARVVEAGADDVVVVTVTDRGQGVPNALLPTLFSGLRTLGRPTRDRSRGTGLGLALVRGLTEAMGGRIWHEANPGGGAVFRLAIPVPGSRP
ncbi:MAG: ATP-binding protein [Actinomycetota bacterium]|nr:ATP-binding protein [Actinomycetota bacterium]